MLLARIASAVIGTALLVATYTLAALLVTGPGLGGRLGVGGLAVAAVGFGVGLVLLANAANGRV